MSVGRVNEWAKANLVKWTLLTGIVMFAFLFAFGLLILNQAPEIAAAYSGTYVIVFSVVTAALKTYRSRRDKDLGSGHGIG